MNIRIHLFGREGQSRALDFFLALCAGALLGFGCALFGASASRHLTDTAARAVLSSAAERSFFRCLLCAAAFPAALFAVTLLRRPFLVSALFLLRGFMAVFFLSQFSLDLRFFLCAAGCLLFHFFLQIPICLWAAASLSDYGLRSMPMPLRNRLLTFGTISPIVCALGERFLLSRILHALI